MSRNGITRKWLSVLLAVVMVFGYAGLFSSLTIRTAEAVTDGWNVKIAVPETVYMTPQDTFSITTTSVQYYVNNTIDSNGNITLDAVNNATSGKFYIYSPSISSVQSVTLSGASYGSWNLTKSGNLTYDTSFTLTLSSAIASKGTSTITWTIVCLMTDGTYATFYAYTVAYNPYLAAVVSVGSCRNERGDNSQLDGFAWTSGIHGIESDGNWYSIKGCSPLGHTITSDGGDTGADDEWTYDKCIYGSEQFGQDKKMPIIIAILMDIAAATIQMNCRK